MVRVQQYAKLWWNLQTQLCWFLGKSADTSAADTSAADTYMRMLLTPARLARLPSLPAERCTISCDASLATLAPESWLPPVNPETAPWLRSLVWWDFRVAVALFVAAPLALLGWSVARCRPLALGGDATRDRAAETALRLLTGYWQASSLLLLTVGFNIEQNPVGVVTGLAAQAMILVSLWWWSDLTEEMEAAEPSALRSSVIAWRALATVAAAGGVLVQLPFQPCALAPALAADASCGAWLEPPQFAAGLVGLTASPTLATVTQLLCGLYASVLAYYGAVLLPRVGRRGLAPRPALMRASPIGAWRWLGFIDEQDPE